MIRRQSILFWVAGAVFPVVFGCSSPPRHLIAPAAMETPRPPPAVVAAAAPVEAPEPVYRNPKIGKVVLRAHQDAQGRLFGPQVMYQVVDPGGWNIDALEEGRAPSAETPAIIAASSIPNASTHSPLADPEFATHVTITGLMRREDRVAAETLAQKSGDRAALFDEEAGWLLIPLPESGGHTAEK